jgi:D-tyrosyl-tRNA(Tyr) deacylase
MKALIQRVDCASVKVNNEIVGEIQQGILLFIGIEKNDESAQIDKMVQRVLSYRVFYDDNEKMNLSLKDIGGELLVVSQFTLAADTKSGTRAGFSTAKPPQTAKVLYEYFLKQVKQAHSKVASGQFGADMKISLVNNGPITFLLSC